MAVSVKFAVNVRPDVRNYSDANGFRYDDKNNLHVTKGSEDVAIVQAGYWLKAELVEEKAV